MKNFNLIVTMAIGILAATQLSAGDTDSMKVDPLLVKIDPLLIVPFTTQLSAIDIDDMKGDKLTVEPFSTSPLCQIDPAFNKLGA